MQRGLSGTLARRHDQALVACGRLDAVSMLLPEPDLFLYAYVRREALLSSQIEGTQSSLSDLFLFEIDEIDEIGAVSVGSSRRLFLPLSSASSWSVIRTTSQPVVGSPATAVATG